MTMEVDLTKGVYRRIYAGTKRDRRFNGVSVDAALLFIHLHFVADDFGNLPGSPDLCRAEAAPLRKGWDDAIVSALLDELAATSPPLIRFYEFAGERLIHICGFLDRQPANRSGRRIRRFPECPFEREEAGDAGESGSAPGNPGEPCASDTDSRSDPDSESKSESENNADAETDSRGSGSAAGSFSSKNGIGVGSGRYRGKTDDRQWVQLVLIELIEALGITEPGRVETQRRPLMAVIKRFADEANRDELAHEVIACAAEKRNDHTVDHPVRAWQAEMNRRFPGGRPHRSAF